MKTIIPKLIKGKIKTGMRNDCKGVKGISMNKDEIVTSTWKNAGTIAEKTMNMIE